VRPCCFLRTAITVAHRRRLRYRSSHDDVLASSRFTIPVSLILPLDEATSDLPSAILRLLEFRYPNSSSLSSSRTSRMRSRH
jgi:hypothetical protein